MGQPRRLLPPLCRGDVLIRPIYCVGLALVLAACSAPGATTRWLPPPPLTVDLARASRDTPAFELAYGPRPQASLGGRLPLVQRGARSTYAVVDVHALGAFENASTFVAMPLELFRAVYGVSGRWLWRDGRDSFALGLGWGREQARTLGQAVLPDRPAASDIAFGGGGTWLALLAEWQHRAPRWQLTVMLEDRLHLAGLIGMWPKAQVVGDVLGGMAGDGLRQAPNLDVVVRARPAAAWQPLLAAHADLQVPADEFARLGWYVRALVAAAHPSQHGETMPFVSFDAGNGKGYLINRREVRLSVGVRHGFF